MAKKKRCNLCGAKLKGNICQECGYNNAAYNYKVGSPEDYCGHSSSETFYDNADHEEHTASAADSWDYSHIDDLLGKGYEETEDPIPNEAPVTYGLNEERPKKEKKKRKWIKWLILIWLLPTILELLFGVLDGITESDTWEYIEDTFSDEEVYEVPVMEKTSDNEEMTADTGISGAAVNGTPFQANLGTGIYMAGLHIPAGMYEAQLISGEGSVYIRNNETGYWESDYLYEESSKKDQKMKELELTAGTQIRIIDNLVMQFTTEASEGYLSTLSEWENRLEEEDVEVEDGMIAGIDFPAGTYDVICTPWEGQNGMLAYKYYNYHGEEALDQISFYGDNKKFWNLTFADGDVLMKFNCDIMLTPAKYDLSAAPVIW